MIKLMRDPAYAPCCFIIGRERADGTFDARDEANTVLVQTDYDYPGVAQTFGAGHACPECSDTDGTIDCEHHTAAEMIEHAGNWLHDNVGAIAEDPGYFS